MGVQYTRITSNPVTLQQIGQALHSALVAAGWTLEYADADAQIGGVGGAPGWGKAPAANTSAGKAVYRMPASGSLNRWYVQVEFRWSGIITSIQTRFTTAKGVDSATGVLIEPGTVCGYDSTSQNNNGGDCYLAAFEHGLLVAINSTAHNYFLGLERRRSLTGQYLDDVVAYGLGSAPAASGGWTLPSSGSSVNLARSWNSGEYGSQPLAALIGVANNGTPPAPTTYNAQGNSTGYPAGLFSTSGGLGGMLRLLMLWLPNDAPALGSQSVRIDGADRTYFATGSGGLSPMTCRLAVATQ